MKGGKMKKLILSLVLVLILSCTFTTSVFAGEPPEQANKGLERTTAVGTNDQSYQSMLQGFIAPVYYGSVPSHVTWWGPIWGYYVIKSLI
jgi:hypothetical protein